MITARFSSRWEIRGLHPYLSAELRRELTFPNPLYVQLGKLGKFRRHVPQVVCYAEEMLNGALHVPRGFDLKRFLATHGEGFTFVNGVPHQRSASYPNANITPRPYQQRCIDAALESRQGYIVAPTGSGKTVMGLSVIAAKRQRALVLVHTKGLLDQWVEAIKKFLGVDAGIIGGGKDSRGLVTVAMIQTLASKKRQNDSIDSFGLVLLDECHHAPASTYTSVLDRCSAWHRYGLSATHSTLAHDSKRSLAERCSRQDRLCLSMCSSTILTRGQMPMNGRG